jgi:Recombinase
VYAVLMSRRRQQRRAEKERRHAQSPAIVREATRVERLAYTRTQAAEALGVSRSTFNRRVLPYVETVETPWGGRLIPADELERLVTEWRQGPRERKCLTPPPGRPASVPPDVVTRIRAERAAGKSLAQIARDLNASGTPTAHGGVQWWPSSVRAVLVRSTPPAVRNAV